MSKHSTEKHKDKSKVRDRGQKEHKSHKERKEQKEHKHKRRAEDEPRREDGGRASEKRQKLPDEALEAGAGRSGDAQSADRQANGAEAAPSGPKPAAGSEPEAGRAPGAVKPQVQDGGGELSMSVEETNRCVIASSPGRKKHLLCQQLLSLEWSVGSWPARDATVCHKQSMAGALRACLMGRYLCRVRISLGLKPLVIGDGGAAKAEAEKRAAERAEEARRAQAEELAERVKACVFELSSLPCSCA